MLFHISSKYFQISLWPRKSAYVFMLIAFILSGCAAQFVEYDFVIVGGGAAGSLLASRLSEVSEWSVLLIEAGGEENVLQDIPLFAAFSQLTSINWGYETEPSSTACLGLVGGQCKWPRGKVLGGSSVLNYMVSTRGNRKDYDGWEEEGCEGWGYDDVLPYFLRFEGMLIPRLAEDTVYHNASGQLAITYPPYRTEAARSFTEAAKELGFNKTDYNAGNQIGYSFHQCTMKDGLRFSGNRAFLKFARTRPNLHVLKKSLVTKILIDSNSRTASGVQYKLFNGLTLKAFARKEVILSAGAINSPQLLMLSGIGPREELQSLGINVLQDAKVGFNLQDHISFGTLYFTVNSSIGIRFDNVLENLFNAAEYLLSRTGPFAVAGGTEALVFQELNTSSSNSTDGVPDIEILFASSTLPSLKPVWDAWGGNSDIYAAYEPLAHKDSFMIFPMIMHPRSRGRVALRSADPTDKPLLYHNYLTDPYDADIIISGIHSSLQLVNTSAFQKYAAELYPVPLPPCEEYEFASDKYWNCSIRYTTFTFYHQCGTCKMGNDSDQDAVVDTHLKVRGINNLRVVDASIIPLIPSGHLTTPVYMIAEKAADLIKNRWSSSDKV
ncbi:glucose dehydrogenase [FAD, quinone]-like [Zootermopsis nevadensis]|uniref:Glucose dehydrogenase [acceptor] n=1 Tax=Zootermopsis nevadensis TaxID=136037 RepID=A0A067QQG8_ZOONE|nr:glucose dehydrogenase [FAD, quinone]-like [Zootermopsis nevadensis]KDR06647.1 Glucose dehydrogenase [acceptor] [Zootermopsis nevadensis]